MTEDEAKTKTCHKTLAADIFNLNGSSVRSPKFCIGSACMAWRWQEAYPRQADDTFANRSATQGFCGLAGKL